MISITEKSAYICEMCGTSKKGFAIRGKAEEGCISDLPIMSTVQISYLEK